MKTLRNRIFTFLVCMIAVFACICGGLFFGLAQPYASADVCDTIVGDYIDDNVKYDNIEKQIVIDEHKVCSITELMKVTYENGGINVGLVRQVARVNEITRYVNGKRYVTKTIGELFDLDVKVKRLEDDDFAPEYSELENEGEFYYINIGELQHYKTAGTYIFQISYKYDFGEDFISEFDDFTFDLMDYDYISPVHGFQASVTFPKKFLGEGQELDDVLLFRQSNSATKTMSLEGVEGQYIENENGSVTITCGLSLVKPGSGLTMQLILPNKYFDTSFSPSSFYYVVLVVAILAIIGIVVCLIACRKGRKTVITPEFYPPKGYNPIDVAKAYRGYVKSKDFASLVLYWASQGYVELIPRREGKAFTIKKLKDMEKPIAGNGNYLGNKREKAYFDALFAKSDVYDTEYSSSHVTNSKLSSAIDNLYEIDSTTKKKTRLFKWAIQILAILPIFFFIIWNITIDTSFFMLLFIFLFPLIALIVFVHVKMGWALIWFKVIWCAGFGIAPFFFMKSFMLLTFDVLNLFWLNVAILVAGTLAVKLVRVYSPEYKEVRGKILGFKNFLVKVEVDKLERLIYDDPKYYLNILPFCYVFGITKIMEKKFASLRVELPEYVKGYSTTVICAHLGHSMGSISRTSSHGGGGGFSGSGGGHGGSSGGGGGGGGSRGR